MRVRNGQTTCNCRLPKQIFQKVEFLQSTGTQYIDTEYVPKTTNCIIELDMAWTGTTVSDFESFAGFMKTGTVPRNGLHKYTSVFMFGANNTIRSSKQPASGQRILLKGDFTSGNQKLYLNNEMVATTSTTYNHSSNNLSIYIFNRNYEGPNNYAKMKLYSAKIYEGNTLIRYYIPVREKFSSEAGLYDLVTGMFCTNKGTGSFTIGDDQNLILPNEYQEVEYIQSTGTQRIKLNIIPTSKYKIEEVFTITDTTVTSCIWCARGSTTSTNTTTAFYIANSGVRCDYGASAAMTNIGALAVNIKHTLTMDAEKWYLDGSLKTSMSAASFTSGGALTLFYSYYNGQDNNKGNYAKLKLYSFKVWDNTGTLVGNFIPCYRKTDNIIGLYDTVNDGFYQNSGTGTFSKGDQIIYNAANIINCSPK